jgi:very-short-patch-repair endonuclease
VKRGKLESEARPHARHMRTNATDAERLLWRYLRDRRLRQFKFRRQQPLGPFIVDFVCFEARVVIEADGGQHQEQAAYDEVRTRYLQARGYRVLRFWNNDILQCRDAVLETIVRALARPHPGPPP